MYWDVTKVNIEQHLKLQVQFSDGTCGFVIFMPSHLTGVFLPLKNPSFFKQVFINQGAVSWPGEIDLAPDAMYQQIKQNGQWILN